MTSSVWGEEEEMCKCIHWYLPTWLNLDIAKDLNILLKLISLQIL